MVTPEAALADTESSRFARLLACAALHPGLRSVLLFGATYEQLKSAARILSELLEAAAGKPAEREELAWYHAADDLWGVDVKSPWNVPGRLTPPDGDRTWRVVVIRDLSNLNLAVLRACVQIVGADYVRFERHGRSRGWQPRLLWLAACPRQGVGRVSPHLVDRFALRWTFGSKPLEDRTAALQDWLEGRKQDQAPSLAAWRSHLRACRGHRPQMTDPAIERVEGKLAEFRGPGLRPHLTLARLALAVAWMGGAREVTATQVDEAATLLGVDALTSVRDGGKHETDREGSRGNEPSGDQPKRPSEPDQWWLIEDSDEEAKGEYAQVPEHREEPEILVQPDPWPEVHAEVEREHASLQPPLVRFGRRLEGAGMAIGVRPTSDVREIALLPTLFVAAAFQPGRKQAAGREEDDPRWMIEEMDLRAWRRAAVPQELLVLVLDATSYGRSDWPGALVPYIRRAYIDRAAVCLVLVGAAGTENELSAERILARNVLVPAFRNALDRSPDRATPLADGLQLALETLRNALQHGRDAVERAQLIVLSDGRGNVPLEVSRGEPLSRPVGRRGIDDALRVARDIAQLRAVESTVLDPQPRYGRQLTRSLAEALRAETEVIPLLMATEEPG